jgi:CRISPR-associated protein Csm5
MLPRKAKFADDDQFMIALFSDFELTYQNRSSSVRTGPNTDFMRAVQVTDSSPLIEEKTTNKKGQPIFNNLYQFIF